MRKTAKVTEWPAQEHRAAFTGQKEGDRPRVDFDQIAAYPIAVPPLTEQHRIAMPAVRVSNQAILLQMACEKEFGVGHHSKLDAITLAMAHPDATIAMVCVQYGIGL